MKIVILSDLHIAESGSPIWDTDTTAHFNTAIDLISGISSIDAIFVSGDIADKGSQWAYDYVSRRLDCLCIPTYFVPGNHDNVNILRSTMNTQWCHHYKTIDIKDWRFILLSSVVPDPDNKNVNMGRGYLSKDEMSWFRKRLNTDKKVCIILHHPPIEPEGWLNRKILENRFEFNEIIKHHKNVKLVIYGHTHCHSIQEIGDVKYICAPSIGFAFNKSLPRFQIDKGHEGFLIIDINNQYIECNTILLNE